MLKGEITVGFNRETFVNEEVEPASISYEARVKKGAWEMTKSVSYENLLV